MREAYEISDRFIEAADADHLLYEPLPERLAFRRTRRYLFEFSGDEEALGAFVRRTLFDPISQSLHRGEEPALEGFLFALDYGMKPGALDLEKEAVLAYHAGLESPGFSIESLVIRQRLYLFGEGKGRADRFVRDLCNPAIHQWNVIQGNA